MVYQHSELGLGPIGANCSKRVAGWQGSGLGPIPKVSRVRNPASKNLLQKFCCFGGEAGDETV